MRLSAIFLYENGGEGIFILIIALINACLIQIGTEKISNKENQGFKEFIIISIILGAAYVLFYEKYKAGLDFFKYSSVITVMLLTALVDLETKSVYFFTSVILFFMNLFFMIFIYLNGGEIKNYVYGGIAMAVISYALAFFKVFGFGDVEIFIICGMVVGIYKSIVVLILSSIFCGIYGIYKLFKDRKLRGSTAAFVPYITAALIITIAY